MTENDIDVGSLIKKSFKSIRYDPGYIILFLPIVLMTIIFYVVIQLLFVNDFLTMIQSMQSSALTMTQSSSSFSEFTNLIQEKIWILMVILIFYMISMIIISTAIYASVIKKVESEEKGEKITVSEAFSRGLPVFPRLLLATLLAVLIIGLPIIFLIGLIVLGVASNVMALVCFSSLIMVLLIVPLIYFAFRLSLFAPACVVDDYSPVDSLKRSWRITKGNVLLIFATVLIVAIIAFVIMAPFIVINSVTSASQLQYSGYTYNSIGSIANLIGQVVVLFIIGPVSIIIYTLLYLKLSKKYTSKTENKEMSSGPNIISP